MFYNSKLLKCASSVLLQVRNYASKVKDMKMKLSLISTGIGAYWKDFQDIRRLRILKGHETSGRHGKAYNSQWSRREIDMAKRNKHDTAVVALTALVFAIPGGSVLVLSALIMRPQYLTNHFWSDNMRDEFMLAIYMKRFKFRKEILTNWDALNFTIDLKFWENIVSDRRSWSCLQSLGLYYGLVNEAFYSQCRMLFNWNFSSHFLKIGLDQKFMEILIDDELLALESNIKTMRRDELQRACLERMLCPPSCSDSEMVSLLESWINLDENSKRIRFFFTL